MVLGDLDTAFTALGPPRTRPLFVMEIGVDRTHLIGGPAGIDRRVGDIGAGHFRGERLSGEVFSGGTDWQILRADGALLLDARVVLRTDDDAVIAMDYTGIRVGPPTVMARLARGEPVEPSDYYFRTSPRFATVDPRYEWLNRIVAVGIGHRRPAGPIYSIFEIL
ncbi:MAG: DUF3237 domain-containing protein [Sphingopyxis sp.]|nr:DUF3237 domain-containing protein [Sphingopyxis sp.]